MFGLGAINHFFYPWGYILQGLAILHFIKRRPDTYWIYVILFLGPVGAVIYLFAEVIPEFSSASGGGFKVFPRRKRIAQLVALVQQNPAPGNYEELGDLYMEDGKLALAREAFDRSIAARGDTLDAFYRRGVCAVLLGDAVAAIPDLQRAVDADPRYDFDRAMGLLAQAYAMVGEKEKAEGLFVRSTTLATLSETYLNFAELLASEGRNAEARAWAQKVLDKKPNMPRYQQRRERKWFRAAAALMKRV